METSFWNIPILRRFFIAHTVWLAMKKSITCSSLIIVFFRCVYSFNIIQKFFYLLISVLIIISAIKYLGNFNMKINFTISMQYETIFFITFFNIYASIQFSFNWYMYVSINFQSIFIFFCSNLQSRFAVSN